MKKMVKVVFPENLAPHFAKYNFENGNTVALAYAKDFFFDGIKVVAFVVVEDGERLTAFNTEFKNYIQL